MIKSTILVAAVAMATSGASATDANDPSTSGSGLLGAVHGPHPGYYKFRGSQQPTGQRFFSAGNPFETCKEWMQNDLHLDSSDMKGNYQLQVDGFLCQGFNTNDDVVLVKNGDQTWKTFKGNLAMTDTIVSSSRKSNRKVLQSPEDDNAGAGADQVGSTAQGYGMRWVGTAVASHTFKATDPWNTCNPYCSNAKGLNQYNMAGTAVITGDQIQCSCFNTAHHDTRLVDATSNYYAFSGSHV
jgi:hypothetical protein